MDQSKDTFLVVLGAGASRSSGLPIANEISQSMIEISSIEDLGQSSREVLRIVGNKIKELNLNTVDDLAKYIYNEYQTQVVDFSLFYLAQWTTCVLFQHHQLSMRAEGVSSYLGLFEEIATRAKVGIETHILSFNYDGILKLAYEKCYGSKPHLDLKYICGEMPWCIRNDFGTESLQFFYYKAHGSIDFLVPLDSSVNPSGTKNLFYDMLEDGCKQILEYYLSSKKDRNEFIKFSMPGLPIIIFPSHYEIFPKTENITRILKEQIERTKKNLKLALEKAKEAKAIGYSFPQADYEEWWPIVKSLWLRDVPLSIECGELTTHKIVESLKLKIRIEFKNTADSKLSELIRPLPIRF